MENNFLYKTLTNNIISNSRNNNNKKEYGITDPRSIKDTSNEGTRVANKNINYTKEKIPTSNTYPYESNNNTNTQNNEINIGRNKSIRQ